MPHPLLFVTGGPRPFNLAVGDELTVGANEAASINIVFGWSRFPLFRVTSEDQVLVNFIVNNPLFSGHVLVRGTERFEFTNPKLKKMSRRDANLGLWSLPLSPTCSGEVRIKDSVITFTRRPPQAPVAQARVGAAPPRPLPPPLPPPRKA